MAFCSNCGQKLPEGANACPACGTFVNGQPVQQAAPQQAAPEQPVQQAAPQQPAPQQPVQQPAQLIQPEAQPQQAYGAPVVDDDVQSNKGIAWLSYLGLLLLIPLFARKKSGYCRFHVTQGAILFVLDIAYLIVTRILLAIINAIFPGSWWYYFYVHSAVYNVFNIIFNLGTIFFLVLAIIGIVNAATGKKAELPLIGKIPFLTALMDKIYAALNKE